MEWGFYCRTCGVSSPRFYQDPSGPWKDLAELSNQVDVLSQSGAEANDARKLRIMVWVASHLEHDLWAECDTGVLRLVKGRPPVTGSAVSLPSFARS